MRIFSHTCSNTEIVCALGCAGQLVGIDADSDYPPDVVAPLPKLGRDLNLDVDAVLALRPDIVLTSLTVPGHEKVVAGLQAHGLQTLICDPQSLDDVFADIQRIADRLDVAARGKRLAADMQAAMPAVAVSGPRPRVLVEWWPKPVIVPARHSWVNALIERAGGSNPLAQADAKSVTLDPVRAQAIDPEAIVMSWCGVRVEKYRAEHVRLRCGWEDTAAVRNDRIYPISEEFLGRPGPRLVIGYRHLRAIIETLHRTP
ncbi:MAG: ABC transporter substrate-binding protein [Nevskiaceae bacterium]|nr:MAG: ABC transporter substrate-binding protein [Nevskiaceae bacterium]TBR73376.1 MAG: ABC transporter substrate-binding protein [Nevskiaceae bacterium]